MAALVIVVAAMALFAVGGGILGEKAPRRKDGQGATMVGRAAARGKDAKCMERLRSVRQAVEVHTDPVDDVRPTDLSSVGLSPELVRCPNGDEPYVYDPASGKVACAHPGHEKH
jgi:hypothetical protein